MTFLSSPHGRKLSLKKPAMMGILNVTPDSFYDRGKFYKKTAALKQAVFLVKNGCVALDIGGESTGPGSHLVALGEELRRVIRIIKAIRKSRDQKLKNIWISIDTYKAEVARQALEAGADMINDVTALRGDPKMAKVISEFQSPVILMYAKDVTPRTTRKKIRYRNVIKTVKNFLKERVRFAFRGGIRKSQIIIDPGMGAFVSGIPRYSFEILRHLPELTKLGFPICVGPSMKSFLGTPQGGTIEDRKIPSIFAGWYALQNGASIIRVHYVPFTQPQDHRG